MSKWILIVAAILLGFLAMSYFGEDHQKFLAWSADRDAWHRKCDVYVGKTPLELGAQYQAAQACKTEFEALMGYAERQGWSSK